MASDLNAEFDAGLLAHLEGKGAADCPFYATSPCADAWHAGRAFAAVTPTDFMRGKVTHGRGYSVNVAADKRMRGRFSRLVYTVRYTEWGGVIVDREWMEA